MKRAVAVISSIIMVFLFASVHAQELLQLGELSYSRAPAPFLRQAVSVSPIFFRAVGGVAFDAVAVGRDGLYVADLEYNSKLPDGKRLVVSVSQQETEVLKVESQIYDWQLIPIALFAASNEGSAMTLFGLLDDDQFRDELLRAGGRAINYHPALDNTLVGLRLMQADIMLFDQNATDLPKNVDGDYVLGAGEIRPNINLNTRRFKAIQDLLKQEEQLGNTYSSYVVGDIMSTVKFYIENGVLKFSGRPTWVMWDTPYDYRTAIDFFRLVEAAREGDQEAIMRLNLSYEIQSELLQDLNRYAAVIDRYQGEEIPTEVNEQLSEKVSRMVEQEAGINPVVYDTLIKVMNYRALFKHFKSRKPLEFDRFVSSLAKVKIFPVVTTPTVQRYGRLH